jgi:hypothetical protein
LVNLSLQLKWFWSERKMTPTYIKTSHLLVRPACYGQKNIFEALNTINGKLQKKNTYIMLCVIYLKYL